jgi:hypothetical protein
MPTTPMVSQKLDTKNAINKRSPAIIGSIYALLICIDLRDMVGSLDAISEPTNRSINIPK